MKQMFKDLKLPLLLLVLISLCAIIFLPITPIDETRYVSVAWDMWMHHSFIVPLLNGVPYSHKPPLLFWLMQAGWAIFGVNDYTPRLIPGIFSLLNLMLVYRISLRLWPQERKTAACASLILASCAIWDAWSIAIMFDMVLTFWILLGLLGTLRATERRRGGWLLLGIGIGGGLLAKGPAVLVYLLSIPLLRAWWDVRRDTPSRIKWVLAILGVTVLGFAAALLWAVPAAIKGGEVYRQAILWGQTVGRMASAEAPHHRPLWWYLPIVPLFFFPWIVFRPSFAKFQLKTTDTGTRFCLTWIGLPLLIFSLISGKQIHYLIPFIPAGALLIGRNIARAEGAVGKTSARILGGLFILLGLVALTLPLFTFGSDVGQLAPGSTRFASAGLLIAGAVLLLFPFRTASSAAKRIAIGMALIFFFGIFEDNQMLMKRYNMKEVAQHIKGKMDEGRVVANIGKYHGQYQFLGRLERPIIVLDENPKSLADFEKRNPGALFISYPHSNERLPEGANVIYTHPYRGKNVVLWEF
jgi:4-amino-4-deoxy-L-arabinose transferase-like glycosyltransferase